ncbi:hypothetical protein [Bdellovibrio bacteriovorus]|uniref:Metallothionein n=1 Tax=Bdellovibrio bacteriovorus TaxID=959 RepID=A0A150WKA5_BDEBC|nr:hypothetical protein [Bdellovibrio bacteriovorus]KYG62575.1 hypothetical protein AZI87_14835 [Bdellovibrio bacteriovorus]KYG64429.1 hypothetical protein AZI85_03130 [Bdellovibrio bacteriovorus]
MGTCENCGNVYDKAFRVTIGDQEHVFDSFECAINQLAPRCEHCRTRIIGHGLEAQGKIYCCAHCSHADNVKELKDRI